MECTTVNEEEKFKFRFRVGAVIIEKGCLLMAKNKQAPYYYSIGGGVNMSEIAEFAVKREVLEETGEHYEVDKLVFVHENFFRDSYVDCDHRSHELALYFLMKPRGTQQLHSNSYTAKGIKEEMFWLPLDSLNDYEIFPAFFKNQLDDIFSDDFHVKHIVTLEQ